MKRDPLPLLVGLLTTALISGTLVIAGLKAGITPGVSPLVILFAWGAFTRRIAAGGGTRFLNIAQVAGSGGMAICAGAIFTAPMLQILHTDRGIAAMRAEGLEAELPHDASSQVIIGPELKQVLAAHGHVVPEVDTGTIMLLSFAGAMIGFGFVGLGTRKFLTDPTLPAPEARACQTLITTAVSEPGKRPNLARSLYLGLTASFLAPLLSAVGAAKEHVVLYQKNQDGRTFQLDLPFTPIYIGIGGLLSLATALLVFTGAMLRLIGDFLLAGVPAASEAATRFPGNSMRWVGGGAMTVAVGYSLVRFLGLKSGKGEQDPLVEIDPPVKRLQWLAILVGIVVIFVWLLNKDGATPFTFAMSGGLLVCCGLMVVLGAILSLQIGSSASPVSGTIFVTTLILCLVALAVGRKDLADVRLLMPLLVGACVAVCAANDSSQDYKTLQLCGMRPQEGFMAQFLGLCVGCLVVPIVIGIADRAYVLGSPKLIAPQGKMFATLVDGLLLQDMLPWSPIWIGLAIGALAVGMDILGSRRGIQLPAMALAVGIYLPAYLGIGILIGSIFRWLGERGRAQTNESILAAAGLITGAALFELLLGIAIVAAGFDPARLHLFDWGFPANALTVLGIVFLGGVLYLNSRHRERAA